MPIAVKICGLVRPEDAQVAALAGADYLGVILTPGFSRSLSPDRAALVFSGAGARRVGVFVDPRVANAADLARHLDLDVIQLHGREGPEIVAAIRDEGDWEVWKAVRAAGGPGIESLKGFAGAATGVVVDSWHPTKPGGSGVSFPWEGVGCRVRDALAGVTFVAAGGLTPVNVCGAIRAMGPDVVDVSSGVESVPGAKDAELVRAFVEAARSCDREGGLT